MIFYKANNQLYPTQADARAVNKNFEQIDVPTDKPGLMAFINDLLAGEPVEDAAYIQDFTPQPVSYATQAIAFEDGFETMPLPLKLHFAALAMEAARDSIRDR